jgi:hypothetical protein
MISILFSLLFLIIVAGILWYVITLLPLPPPFGVIAQLILLLIIVAVLFYMLVPVFGSGYYHNRLGP